MDMKQPLNNDETFKEDDESLQSASKIADVDEFFLTIGQFDRAQKLLCFLIYLLEVPHSYATMYWFFTGHSPPWKCSLKSNETISQCNRTGTFDVGHSYYNSRCSMNRESWDYVQPSTYSIVTEWDLVCKKKEYPYFATSLMWIGWAIGAFSLGFFSDRFGRKKVLFSSWSGLIVLTFISSLLHSFWIYAFFAFLIGCCQGGVALTIYVMASELVSPTYRSLASGALTGLTYTLSLCLLSLQSWLIPEWRKLLMVLSAPYLILLFSAKLIPESIRWLRLNHRLKEAEGTLQRICRMNGNKWPSNLILSPPYNHGSNRNESVLGLFFHTRLAINTLIQGFVWFVIGQVYFGISLASDQLGGNIYRDFVFTSLVGIPGNLLVILLTNRYGRKPTLIGSMAFGSFSCIGVSLIHPQSDYTLLRVTFGMIGQLCLSLAFSSMYSWSLELMPTTIRSQALGMLNVLIRFGGSSAPWVAQWLKHFHYTLPFAVMGSLALISAVIITQLSETMGIPTIETLEDAMRLLKGEKFPKPMLEDGIEDINAIEERQNKT